MKNHHKSILYYWNKGVRTAPAIHRETNIPLRTIYYSSNKLKQVNSLEHRDGNGRPLGLSGIERKAIGQYIRCNNEIIFNELKESLSRTYHKTASTLTINTFVEIDLYQPGQIHSVGSCQAQKVSMGSSREVVGFLTIGLRLADPTRILIKYDRILSRFTGLYRIPMISGLESDHSIESHVNTTMIQNPHKSYY